MNYFRDQFPILKDSVYFDIAYKASVPNGVVQAINQFYAGVQFDGGRKENWDSNVNEAKRKAARLINAATEEIAFVKNTSEGLNMLANSIYYQPGNNIIVSDQEHINNIFPWTNLSKFGVEVRQIQSQNYRFGIEEISKVADNKTRIVSISTVCTASGFRPDIEEIGNFCKENDIYFFLDGVQSLGALDMDVRTFNIDAIATSGHKWLLGPYGSGFLYCRQDLIKQLRPIFAAKLYTSENPEIINTALCEDARRWEIGSLNYSGICALGAGLDMILSIGTQGIEKRIMEMIFKLRAEIEHLGLEVITPIDRRMISGILSFKVNNPEQVVEYLRKERIFLSLRRGLIRVSIHFYNNEDDIERFIHYLKSIYLKAV